MEPILQLDGPGSVKSSQNDLKFDSETKNPPRASKQKYFDTHCHIPYILDRTSMPTYKQFREIYNLPESLEGVISVFCDSAAFSPTFGIWQELLAEPEIFGAFGMHPHNSKYYNSKIEAQIIECLSHPKAVAWGECGLDYHYKHSTKDDQKKAFTAQLQAARKLQRSVVVHSRDAAADTLRILKENWTPDLPLHVHCFGDKPRDAHDLLKEFPKCCIGITGAVTFAQSEMRNVVKEVPLDRLLLETDGPYMVPSKAKKYANGICHPGMIPYVANEIASIKGVDVEEVYSKTRDATRMVYHV